MFGSKKLRKTSDISRWPTCNNDVSYAVSKPSWFSCSCSSAVAVSSICCYRDLSIKRISEMIPVELKSSETDYLDEHCHIPRQVLSLFVYLVQQGGHVNDMFRRPGNITQMKQILNEFASGRTVNWSDYNVYTIANVAKKLLLAIPDGLFGVHGESLLLATASAASCSSEVDELLDPTLFAKSALPIPSSGIDANTKRMTVPLSDQKSVTFADDLTSRGLPSANIPRGSIQQLRQLSLVAERRIAVFLRVLEGLPPSHRQLSVLMLGLLHQLIMNTASPEAKSTLASVIKLTRSSNTVVADFNLECNNDPLSPLAEVPLFVLAEGVVKSVSGALFHTCCSSIQLVEHAAQVLRTLVLFFPAMGDSVTKFYVNAVADRLLAPNLSGSRKTPLEPCGRMMDPRSPCALCPESGHSGFFDSPQVDKGGLRQCPFNLLHAATRLFCLSGSRSTPEPRHKGSLPSVSTATTCQPFAKTSGFLSRLRYPPFLVKAQSTPDTTVIDTAKHVSPIQTVPFSQISPTNLSEQPLLSSSPMGGPTHVSETPASVQSRTEQISADERNQETNAIVEKHVPTLRRNQSRYRSLRRRQMENLSKRAEWFLGPTVLPVVTLTPCKIPADSDQVPYPCGSGIVATSTLSLIDIDDSVRRDLKPCTQNNSSLQPPRILFVASTGELEQQPPESRDTSVVQRQDSGRQRLLSVGSYLEPTLADSFISIYSAPSAGLHRCESPSTALSCSYSNFKSQPLECQSATYYPSSSSPQPYVRDSRSQSPSPFLRPSTTPQKKAEDPISTHHSKPSVVQSESCFSLSS